MIIPQDSTKSTDDASLSKQMAASYPPDSQLGEPGPPPYESHSTITPVLSSVAGSQTLSLPRPHQLHSHHPPPGLPMAVRALRGKRHLSLSALMGDVRAVVYITGSRALPLGGKTRMDVQSMMGTIRLELHAEEPRAPLCIDVHARLGESTLLLPRSFRGPLRVINRLGDVSMSEDLRRATRSFGDSLFVGDWREEELKQKKWPGDEATVDSMMGSVWVGYSDEVKGR
ncbi:hypothetical protein FB45DRAFT_909726 [Roridomyces roridus]|uniref:DUF7330 domain-containing protein n=1 Tax=Roridomyces roridus TaxID=1738132 RepID=A0AAD7C0W1_9AGAR|nr:hypothetical protein FB45DRAFT_909726 [Roridomyces roridus]